MSQVMDILAAQRRRCLAGIMGAAESASFWPAASREEQQAFRSRVIDSLNVFYDLCRDVANIPDDSSVRNEEALKLLEESAAGLQRLLMKFPEG